MDGRQGSLSKYVQNSKNFCKNHDLHLGIPEHYIIKPTSDYARIEQDIEMIDSLISELSKKFDAIILDTPGNKNYWFEAAHQYADTLITPMTDSLVDLGAIVDIDVETSKIQCAGHYSDFVWEIKKQLAAKGKNYLNWIVCGNKISSNRSNNKNFIQPYKRE